MPFNINEFRAALGKHGIMRQTQFAVNITPPASISDPIIADLPLLCDSAQIPGTMFNTNTYQHKGYGLDERRPFAINQEDVTLTFIGDANGKLIKFFDKWGNKIMNSHSDTGPGTERLGYPVDYYGTIEVYSYNAAAFRVSTYTYQQAWPINIGNIQMSWSQNDQYVTIPVTFTYRQHLTHLETDEIDYSFDEYQNLTYSSSRNINAIQSAINPPILSEYLSRLYNIEG
ncbi:tail tube protein [Rhizobium phage RHph_I1_18]|nr:tail tube protein [Rhizobium phage RHph_I1_18]